MLLRCSVNTFLGVGKEFPHTAVEAPKVRAIWNAVRTHGTASSTLCKSTKQRSQCPYPSIWGCGTVHVSQKELTGDINRRSLSRGFIFSGASNATDSMNAVFFCPKRHAIIPESASSQLYLLALWSSGVPVFLTFAQWQTSKCLS